MKLQIFILAIGIAVSAGAVSAELHRSDTSSTPSTLVAVSDSSLKSPVTTPHLSTLATPSQLSLKTSVPKRAIKPLRLSIKPSINGTLGDDD